MVTSLQSMELGERSFADVLHAAGPDRDRAGKLALYGWLVGDWEMDVTTFPEDGKRQDGQGEIHAGWILEGRAIQKGPTHCTPISAATDGINCVSAREQP